MCSSTSLSSSAPSDEICDTGINSYGGPQSQLVDLRYGRNWHDYLACNLSYITVVVDGRGTGFKGRPLRNTVKDNLGFYETIDQVNAAKWVSDVP